MDQDRIDAIIVAYLKGTTTEAEDKILSDYLSESSEHQEYFASLRAVARYIETFPRESKSASSSPRKRRRLVFSRWGWVAVIFLLLSSVALYQYRYHTGRVVYKNEESKPLTISLPDRSRVSLAEGSSLSYNKRTFDRIRKVSLSGQAEFDVTKNSMSPFRVFTSSIEVTVFGTVFKVRDFPSEGHAEAILAEGSIALRPLSGHEYFELSVGQRAVYREKEHLLAIQEVSVDDILLRRHGINSIEDATIHQIIERIQSDFGVSLYAVSVGTSPDTRFTFSYPEKAPLEEILDMLEILTGYRFEPQSTITQNN